MLYFLDTSGNILRVVPERIYQGSTDVNKIMLIAPFVSNAAVEVIFILPDGQMTLSHNLEYIGKMHGLLGENAVEMHAWQIQLPVVVTKNYGDVQVQFCFSLPHEGRITSAVTSFTVERGIVPALPEIPTQDVYLKLQEKIASIQADLVNAFYSARAIYAWNAYYRYGMHEITFFPTGKFGALVQSLKEENANIPIENGIVHTSWKILVSFDNIADSYFEDVQNIAEEAKAQLSNIQEIVQNLQIVQNSIVEVVEALPSVGEKGKIYALLSTQKQNLFALYIWMDKWRCLGEKSLESVGSVAVGTLLYTPQTLTAAEMGQARKNIDAQIVGNYVVEERLENTLTNYSTHTELQRKLEEKEMQIQNSIHTELVAMHDNFTKQMAAVQKKVTDLENNTQNNTGGSSIVGNIGTPYQPVYVENGQLKGCTNLKAQDCSLMYTIGGNCENTFANDNIYVGYDITTRTGTTNSVIMGNTGTASCTNSAGFGIMTRLFGDTLVAVGINASTEGEFSCAFGPYAAVIGEMSAAFGPCANVEEDYAIVLGSAENKNIYYYGALQAKSDMRDKADIEDLEDKKSLQFVNALRTVTYVDNDRQKYKNRGGKRQEKGVGKYDKAAHSRGEKKGKRRRIGLLAQDIEKQMQAIYGKEIASIVNDTLYNSRQNKENLQDVESQKYVNYIAMVPMLVSAIKAQQKQIQVLSAHIQKLNNKTIKHYKSA